MKYLKKFENHASYEEARQNLILPNVSLCEQENEVHYNPVVNETRLTLTYNVEDSEGWCHLYNSNAVILPIGVEIDGTAVSFSDIDYGWYQFSTTGQHTVKIEYQDNTFIPYQAFQECADIVEVIIPDCVVSVGQTGYGGWVFNHCTSLTNVVFNENTLQTVSSGSFCACPLNNEVETRLESLYKGSTMCD